MAVYTKLTTEDIKTILSSYNIGNLVGFSEIITGVENTNYCITTNIGKYILTIFEKRTNTKDIPFYLDLMNFLKDKLFPCPQIYRNKNNSPTFSYKTKIGVIISFLDGKNTAENLSEKKGDEKNLLKNQKNHYYILYISEARI